MSYAAKERWVYLVVHRPYTSVDKYSSCVIILQNVGKCMLKRIIKPGALYII